MKILAVTITMIAVMYLICGFISLSFDFTEWHIIVRIIMAVVTIIIGLIAVVVKSVQKSEE